MYAPRTILRGGFGGEASVARLCASLVIF